VGTEQKQDIDIDMILQVVQTIDIDLERGTRHYWNKNGELLTKLDQVINAIINDDLIILDEKCVIEQNGHPRA